MLIIVLRINIVDLHLIFIQNELNGKRGGGGERRYIFLSQGSSVLTCKML